MCGPSNKGKEDHKIKIHKKYKKSYANKCVLIT